ILAKMSAIEATLIGITNDTDVKLGAGRVEDLLRTVGRRLTFELRRECRCGAWPAGWMMYHSGRRAKCHAGASRLSEGLGLRLVADSLDVVSVRPDDKSPVVAWVVVRSQARSSVVLPARSECSLVEGVDFGAI